MSTVTPVPGTSPEDITAAYVTYQQEQDDIKAGELKKDQAAKAVSGSEDPAAVASRRKAIARKHKHHGHGHGPGGVRKAGPPATKGTGGTGSVAA